MREKVRALHRDSLFKNSFFMMLSTGVMSVLGFLFWTICTRLFTPTEVGIATALLAALNLITSLSLLGFEISIIRILPQYHNKSALLNSCLTIASSFGVVFALLFALLQPMVAPDLSVVRSNDLILVLFVIFEIVSICSYIFESTFIAYRQSSYVLKKNSIFSVVKIALPFGFVAFGAFGIYAAWMLSLMGAVGYSGFVLTRKFSHHFKPAFGIGPLKGMIRYSFDNYLASFAEGLPIMVLPLLVTNVFGPVANAHYYIAMMLATFLFTVPIATTQALFAEGSHEETEMSHKLIRASIFMAAWLIPGILGIVVLGPFILHIFGRDYAGAFGLLRLLVLSAPIVGINALARTILKLRYRAGVTVWASLIGSGVIIGLSYILRHHGLNVIGVAWLVGQLVTAVIYLVLWNRPGRQRQSVWQPDIYFPSV